MIMRRGDDEPSGERSASPGACLTMPSLDLLHSSDPAFEKRLLDYVLTLTERGRSYWHEMIGGTTVSRTQEFEEYRLRMDGRRSVAELYHDAKTEPFEGAANIGTGIESVFSEFLIPLLLSNTHDLEPMLQVTLRGTKEVNQDLTDFHDTYHRFEVPEKREALEASLRELLTVGSHFHKWVGGTLWRSADARFPVWIDPLTHQPKLELDPGTGQFLPSPADPKTPEELIPIESLSGRPYRVGSLPAVERRLVREGPELSLRRAEAIGFPSGETRTDPDLWDWLSDDFDVSPYWLLGREGDPFDGNLRLEKLWNALGIDPSTVSNEPTKLIGRPPVRLRAFHGKYPAAKTGAPLEIVVIVARIQKLLLGWRPSPFPRRPYFNRQVWHAGDSPLGKGIPETIYSLRSAMDALLNQDVDGGNLYNYPPLLVSDLARLEDEDYLQTGPGAVWTMRDINGAKFLPTAIGGRDPLNLLNWLMSNAMRKWGITDLTLNAPTNSLSPNIRTARGTEAILNQGSIKFGHLTKRLASTDTKEFQYVHDSFRLTLSNPKRVTQNGRSVLLNPAKRQEYFGDQYFVSAVGNGISTNPILRQQTLAQFLSMAVQMRNPFILEDLETYKKATEQWIASYGLDLTLKDPQALQQSKLFLELMGTPEGQQILPRAIQLAITQVQARMASQPGASNGNRVATLTG